MEWLAVGAPYQLSFELSFAGYVTSGSGICLSSRFRFLAEGGGGRKPLTYLRSGFVAEQ
jgi:hypothetical protein